MDMQFIAHKLQGAINNPSNLLCVEKEILLKLVHKLFEVMKLP